MGLQIRCIIWAGIGLAVSFVGFTLLDLSDLKLLTAEDGFVENIGAAFFLLTAIYFLIAFLRETNEKDLFFIRSKRNSCLLLLFILFFVAFAEEVSWGQRLLHIATPDAFKQMNVQEEINIHNLALFHPESKDREVRTGWKAFLNFSRLFNLFWFSLCVLVPLLNVHHRAGAFIRRMGIPLVPLALGYCFLLNYLVLKIRTSGLEPYQASAWTEIAETNFAFLFFIVAVYLVHRKKEAEFPRR